MRASVGREGAVPSPCAITWWRAASDSGSGTRRRRRSSGSARPRPSGASSKPCARRVTSSPTRGGSRRAANSSARAEAASSHWTSSIASDERRVGGERRQDADQPGRRRPRIGRFVRLGAQQGNRKRPLLRRGQGRARLVERLAEQVGERNVGELRLALRRTDLEHPVGPVLGSPDRLQPERRLANAGLALDQQSEGARRNPVEEPFDRLQLGLATDYRVHARLVRHSRAE